MSRSCFAALRKDAQALLAAINLVSQKIDACKHAARVGHKLRRGYAAYGMTPCEVCMHQGYYRDPILPRYNSEPVLRKTAL